MNAGSSLEGGCRLVRSRRKTLALHIGRDGVPEIRAPLRLGLPVIETFWQQHRQWAWEKQQQAAALREERLRFRLEDGQRLVYLGGQVTVAAAPDGQARLQPQKGLFLLPQGDFLLRRAAALEEYRRAARELLPERVAYWRERMGVTAGRVSIRAARTRWGSCSGAGNLSFSLYLMMADPEAVDYVVIHELAHRRQMNHSPAFWAVVEEYCPHWRACRERLRALACQLERQNWWGEQEESPSRQP